MAEQERRGIVVELFPDLPDAGDPPEPDRDLPIPREWFERPLDELPDTEAEK